MSASSGGGASTDTGHDEATTGAKVRQTTVVVMMDERRLKAKKEDEKALAGKEEKTEQDGIDNPCYEADEPEEDCRTLKTKSNGTVADSHSGNHETGNGSFLNNTSLTSCTNSAAVETSSDEKKVGDEGEMAEAVNLELVNMRPFGNGINGIPVKKGEADEMGADLGDPYDEYFVPVNEHRKYIRGEKLYVTKDKRQQPSKRRCCCWVMALAAIAAILLAIVAACVILSQEDSAEPVESRNFGASDSVVGAGVGGAGGTRSTPEPPTRPPSERPTTDMSELYVAQALEGEMTIDNMEYTPGLSIHNSSEFSNLATSLETELKTALFDRQTLNYGPFDIFVKVIEFLSGSVVVKYRVGWTPKEGVRTKGVPEPIGKDTLKQRLQEHLRRHEGFLYNYRLRLHNMKASQMVNLCQYDNGGCSDQCMFAYNTSMDFVCSCRAGRMLGEDGKTCSDQDTEEPVSSSPTNSEPQPEPESTAEPISKPEPESTVDGPESIPESSAEPTSEPEPKSEPEPYPEPESSPLPEPTPNPDSPLQPQPEPSPEPPAEPSPEPASEPPPKPPVEPSSELSAEPPPKLEEDATEKHRMVETPPMISVTSIPEDLAGPFPVDSEHNEETGTEHFKDLLTVHHEMIIDNSNDTQGRNQSAIVNVEPALKEQATGKESVEKYGNASDDVNKSKMALENEFTGRSDSHEMYSPFGMIIQKNNSAAPTELESVPEPELTPEPTSELQAEPVPSSTSEVVKSEEVILESAEEKKVVPNSNGLLSVMTGNNESQIVEEKTVTPIVSNSTAEEMINESLSHVSQTPFILPGENLTSKTPPENSTTQAPYLLNHAESVGSNTLVPEANSTVMKTYNDSYVPVKHKKKGSRLDDNQLWVGNTGSPEHESAFVVIHETTTEVGLTEQPVVEKENNSHINNSGSDDSSLVIVKTTATEEVTREPDLSTPASVRVEEASSEEMKLMGTSDHAIVTMDTLISSTVASPLMETVVPNNGDNNFKHDIVSNIVTEPVDLNNLKTESSPSIETMSPTMSSVPVPVSVLDYVTSSIMIPTITESTSISLINNVSQAGENSTSPVAVESIDHVDTHANEMETVETGNNINQTLERNVTTMISLTAQHTTELNSGSIVQSTNLPEYPKGEVQNELKPNVSDLGLAYDHERPSNAVFSNEAVRTEHPLFQDNKKIADSVQLGKEASKEVRKETENHYFASEEEASGTSKPLFDIDKTKNIIVQTTVGVELLPNKGSNESTINSPDLIIELNPGTLSTETKENIGTIPVTQNVLIVDFTSEISNTNIEKPENISVDKYGYKKKDKKANKYDSTEDDLPKNYYEKKGKLEKEKKLDRVAANDNGNNKSPVVELAPDHDDLEEVDVGHSKTLMDYGNAVDVETDKKGKKKGSVLKNVEDASERPKVVSQSMAHQNLTEHPQTNISNTSGAHVTEVVVLEHKAESASLIPTTSVLYVIENATSEGIGASSSFEPLTSSFHVTTESSSLAHVMSVLDVMETASSIGNTSSDSATLEGNGGGSTSLVPTVSESNVTDGATSEVSAELSSSLDLSPLTPASDVTQASTLEPNFESSSLAPFKAATYEVVEITTTEDAVISISNDTLQSSSVRAPPEVALPVVAIMAAHVDEANDEPTTLLPETVTVTSDSNDSSHNATQGNPTQMNDTSMVVDVLPAGFSKCAAGQFQCTNGTTRDGAYCVSQSSKCDSINDCSDSSDELHCIEEGCPGNFKCLDGQCLKRHLVCNGVTDCKDGSDESACGNWTCQFDELQCPSGRCIPTLWQCDGKADCGNHTDEFSCHDSCGNDEYLCPEGWCVPLTWRCNGIRDCANGQDEKLCDCSLEQFKCETGGCVDRTEVCDGVDNCPDNSDEWGCVSLNNTNLTVRSWDNAWAGVCSSSGWRPEWSDLVCRGQGFARAHFTRQEPLPSSATMHPRLLALSPGASLDSPLRLPALLVPASDNCTATVEIACQEFVCGGSGLPDTATAKLLTGSFGNYTWPSVAILYRPDIKAYCTASVVSPKWLLASFNCLRSSDKSLSPLGWTAYAGGSMFKVGLNNATQVRSLRSIIAHPQAHFNQLLYTNNMVLVELLAPFTLSSVDADVDTVVAASCLPEEGVDQGQICLSAGWGYTQPGERNFRQYVNYLPNPSIDLSECNSTEHYPGFIRQTDICTDAAPQTEPCFNDEGAALLCINEGGVWELHGLLSYRRCGHRAAHPAVYSSVSAARPWIEQTIGSKFERKSTFNVRR